MTTIVLTICAVFATIGILGIGVEFSKANKTLSEIEESIHAIYEDLAMRD